MAISDKYLPGNLNQAEMDTVKGIPMSIFNNLSSEEQNQLLGNLNRTEMDQLQGVSDPGMSSEFRKLLGRLIAMGVPEEEILRIIQSRMDAMTGGVPDVGGKIAAGTSRGAISQLGGDVGGKIAASVPKFGPLSRFNQGGIVSLRHLTRPIGY